MTIGYTVGMTEMLTAVSLTVTRKTHEMLRESPEFREKTIGFMLSAAEREFHKDDCEREGHQDLYDDWTQQENPRVKSICLHCGVSEEWDS